MCINRKIICYGAGSAYHWVEEVFERRLGVEVIALIDVNFEQLQSKFNCPVVHPNDKALLKKYVTEFPEIPVFVALGTQTSCLSVINNLTELGFKHVVSLNEIFETHLGFQLDDTHVADFDVQSNLHLAEIDSARKSLADEESLKIFDVLLSIYKTKKGQWIPARPVIELQFPPEFIDKIDYTCVVRCGAALDELQEMLGQNHHAVKKLICFEPDTEKFSQNGQAHLDFLNASLPRSALNMSTEFLFCSQAVSSRNGFSNFLSYTHHDQNASAHSTARKQPINGAFGSRLSNVGNCQVNAVTLDTALRDQQPTLVIADAEGAELDILMGAKTCITQHRPTLIFALYHRFSHLWEIINFIRQNFNGYEFFIRNFTGFAYETFLYAIPLSNTEA